MKRITQSERNFRQAKKLWKILQIAQRDVLKVEQSRTLNIDMYSWASDNYANKLCTVCAAGAVATKSLGKKTFQDIQALCCSTGKVSDKLRAIDYLRQGTVSVAAHYLYPYKEYNKKYQLLKSLNRTIVNYEHSQCSWHEQINRLIKELKMANL